jgi:hypothetical protein
MVLGSCFAENIGRKLDQGGLQTFINPLGIQYNPLSITQTLSYLCGAETVDEREIFANQGLYRHWDVHTRLCSPQRDVTLSQISEAISKGAQFVKHAQWLYLTLGSAHVWMRGERAVSNCHKMPGEDFKRELLSIDQCVHSLLQSIALLRLVNPEINIVMTVSPVRYQRDGLVESQRSKSTLLLAAHDVCAQLKRVHYFPAYELLIDDLRDYRFYARDLVHPSDLAVDYIWSSFQRCAISPQLIDQMKSHERSTRQGQHLKLTR